MTKIIAICLAFALSGCANMTPGQKTAVWIDEGASLDGKIREIEAHERFLARQAACNRDGGVMRIKGPGSRIHKKKFTANEYKVARCIRF